MSRLNLVLRIVLLAAAMVLITAMSAWVVFTFLTRGGEVAVPDLRGQEIRAALRITSREDLGLKISAAGFDPSIPPGHVISQIPDPGVMTRKNRIVRIVVSQGTRTVHVPGLIGLNLRRAELQLTQAGLEVGRIARAHHPEMEEGTVITQTPGSGDFIARGTAVDILISEGRRPLVYLLPDLTGASTDDAMTVIKALGLVPGRIDESETSELPPGMVTELVPGPGSAVIAGQTVHLTVSASPSGAEPLPVFLYRYSAPPGLLDRHLELVLYREGRESTVYSDTIPPGSSVTIPVTVSGAGILRVFVDGSMFEERKVP